MTSDNGQGADRDKDIVPLPPERAFVVQLRAPADGDGERFAGRAEHIASGLVARFASVEELLGFVRQVLTSQARPPADG